MFTTDSCTLLEYKICEVLKSHHNKALNYCWCNGVLMPDALYLSKKYINDNRQIETSAFIGQNGQDKYRLTIKLGSKALSKIARGLSIDTCLPETNPENWFNMDIDSKTVTLWLS